MACHLGAAFDAEGSDGVRRRYTGRHWWGVLDGADSVEPSLGETAANLAERLGLPARNADNKGTSILIVDPLLNNADSALVVDEIVETILWNFWPRMTRTTPAERKIQVRVELEDERVRVPEPEMFPPLDLFAAAMAAQRSGAPSLQDIRCQRPNKHLGYLELQKGVRADRDPLALRDGSITPKQSSHIALMRPVELVVKYVAGEPFPDPRFEWAGVFICSGDEEVEAAFASAEPPAHDDWVPDNLPKGREKTFVRVALRDLEMVAKTHAVPSAPVPAESGRGPSLAATARQMGKFLDRASAAGPGRSKRPGGPPGTRKAVAISPARFIGLESERGNAVAIFRADLKNDGSDSALHILAEPYLVVDGGRTSVEDLPSGFELGVVAMSFEGSRMSDSGPWIRVGRTAGELEVRITTHKTAAVGVRFHLVSGVPA